MKLIIHDHRQPVEKIRTVDTSAKFAALKPIAHGKWRDSCHGRRLLIPR